MGKAAKQAAERYFKRWGSTRDRYHASFQIELPKAFLAGVAHANRQIERLKILLENERALHQDWKKEALKMDAQNDRLRAERAKTVKAP